MDNKWIEVTFIVIFIAVLFYQLTSRRFRKMAKFYNDLSFGWIPEKFWEKYILVLISITIILALLWLKNVLFR
ncbi:MAG: hypothetical protein LBR98_05970 [Syntrophomonadaceae bacterium]|jgi:hypothetical protein|nr:hypothetical protein [Syntrophomonadaceae bacterium]